MQLDRVDLGGAAAPAARRGSPSPCRRRARARRRRARAARTSARRRAAGRSSGRSRSAAARSPTPRRAARSGTNRSRGTSRTALRTRSSATLPRSSSTSRSARSARHHAMHGAGGAQLRERAVGVARLDVDAAHRGRVDGHGEALLQRLERGVLDAVVRGEPDDRHLVDPALAQQLGEVACRRSPSSPPCRGPGPCRRSRRRAAASRSGCSSAPSVSCTQCTGQMPPCSVKEPWSGGCQSRVATTRS